MKPVGSERAGPTRRMASCNEKLDFQLSIPTYAR